MGLAERRQSLAEQQFNFDVLQSYANRGNEDAKAISAAIKDMVPQQHRSRVASMLYSDPEDVNRGNAYQKTAAVVEQLRTEGLITTEEKETFGHIKSTQGGLYNLKTNKWIVSQSRSTTKHLKCLGGFSGRKSLCLRIGDLITHGPKS